MTTLPDKPLIRKMSDDTFGGSGVGADSPPLSNRGVTNALYNAHLDFLTVSYSLVHHNQLYYLFPECGGLMDIIDEVNPFPRYAKAFRLKCGGIYNEADNENQGARLDLSGQALQNLRDANLRDAQILMLTGSTSAKKRTTRMDYCFNLLNAGSVRHTVNHWLAGKVKTTFRKPPEGYVVHGERRGQSVYYGSKTSAQFVRVYDKGAEMRDLSLAFLRVELQTRSPFSGAFFTDCTKSTVEIAARSRIKKLIDFPSLIWWRRLLEGDIMETETVPKKLPKWQKWMTQQVARSIIDHWVRDENGDRNFIAKWLHDLMVNGIRLDNHWQE